MKEQLKKIMNDKFSIIHCKNEEERNHISQMILDINPNYEVQISNAFIPQAKKGLFAKKEKTVKQITLEEVRKIRPENAEEYVNDVINVPIVWAIRNRLSKGLSSFQRLVFSTIIDLAKGKSTYLLNIPNGFVDVDYFVLFNKLKYWVDNPKVVWITDKDLSAPVKEIKKKKLDKEISVYQLQEDKLVEMTDIFDYEEEITEPTHEEVVEEPKLAKDDILFNVVSKNAQTIQSDVLSVEVQLANLDWYKNNSNIVNDLPLTLKEYCLDIERADLIGLNRKFSLFDSKNLTVLGNYKGEFNNKFTIEIVGREKEFALYVIYDELKNNNMITDESYEYINKKFKVIYAYLSSVNDDSYIFMDTDYKSHVISKELVNQEINNGDLCSLLEFEGKVFNVSTHS